MRIAIHQPNFVPHKAYFDKMVDCDLFIFMVHCQWEKGKYQNRFHVGDQWNTMSVNHGLQPIVNKKYLWPEGDWRKITSKHPKLKAFDGRIKESLSETNISIILDAVDLIGYKLNAWAMDEPTELRGTDRLLDLCVRHGATEYLSGISGKKYLELDKFEKAGIKVFFQEPSESIPLINLL